MKTRRWNKNTQFYTAVGLAGILVTVALLGLWLAPHSAFETDFLHTMEAPGRDYPLGTDQVGRCILSRLLPLPLFYFFTKFSKKLHCVLHRFRFAHVYAGNFQKLYRMVALPCL